MFSVAFTVIIVCAEFAAAHDVQQVVCTRACITALVDGPDTSPADEAPPRNRGPTYTRAPPYESARAREQEQTRRSPCPSIQSALSCDECDGAVPLASPDAPPCTQLLCLHCSTAQSEDSIDSKKKLVLEARELSVEALSVADDDRKLRLLERCHELQSRAMWKHNRSLSQTQDAIARIHALRGDFARAASAMRPALATAQHLYGADGLETAFETRKYVDLLLARLKDARITGDPHHDADVMQQLGELKVFTREALRVMAIHRAADSDDIVELQGTQRLLEEISRVYDRRCHRHR
ncbi:PREDICTED: uncharacterized protein LOC106808686 [Priapulus caudatus]|uniref:Uncharacterized protein LOC106808686 n=1 Tax=Priapulus caudatus TaxID=37621 RepID=A0ABM1E473_PRICU|nr:PREDICTED: uncharacterized protein LOC106808686 [Priapulus caudatus]